MWLNLSIQSLKENKYKPFVTGGKGAGHNFWKKDIAQGHNINWLESNGTKMADKTWSWSSISKWNDTPRGAMTVPLQAPVIAATHFNKSITWNPEFYTSVANNLTNSNWFNTLQDEYLQWQTI